MKNNGKKIPTGGELISTSLKGSTHMGRPPGFANASAFVNSADGTKTKSTTTAGQDAVARRSKENHENTKAEKHEKNS